MNQIILASQSPQRQAILASLGIAFQSEPANLDERLIQVESQSDRAAAVALAKAQAIAAKFPQAIILAGDTFVVDGNQALEKPVSLDEARQMLLQQSGRQLIEYTGVAYLDPHQNLKVSETIATKVWFRNLSKLEIEEYISTQPVLTWSGAFCPAYPAGAAMIAKIEGSLTGFTHGFPIEFFVPLLRKSGCLSA